MLPTQSKNNKKRRKKKKTEEKCRTHILVRPSNL